MNNIYEDVQVCAIWYCFQTKDISLVFKAISV